MPNSIFDASPLRDEKAAYAYVEARIWSNGRVCPHCGVVDRSGPLKGKSTRIGVYKCYACRKPFTVKVGTIFEDSHVPMHLWLQAIVMMCGSKKGISSNQLHRTLGVTLRTAWHLSHRIRLAMDESGSGPLGGPGKTLESDETFIGYKDGGPTWEFHSGQGWRKKRAWGDRNAVLTLVEREGRARSIKLDSMKAVDVRAAVLSNADTKSDLKTDELITYRNLGKRFASHEAVNHSAEEWVRGEAHTNTVEGFFSIFKRGMTGIYQHCSERHLHRYLAEFDFRYSNRIRLGVNDAERTARAVKGAVSKRLTYRTTRSQETEPPSA
ncbi:MAG TPA: IS1595 family transposase [Stellaceae bacterium]|nr:IS1595 family transposase [Stellaceae bacterium]